MAGNVRAKIKQEKIEFVRCEFADLHGISRSLILDAEYFNRSASKGIPFVKGLMMHGVKGHLPQDSGLLKEIGFPNVLMYPDYSTFRTLPWVDSTASILMDFDVHSTSDVKLQNPRMHCKRQVDNLQKVGYNLNSAFEFEFYVVKKKTMEPLDTDVNIFTMQKNNRNITLLYDIMRNLRKVFIEPECMHSEYGPGQFEITTCPRIGLRAADDAFRFKHVVKETSIYHDCMSSFMSKPYNNESGCSGHFNHSLRHVDSNKNAMYDENKENKMSDLAENWLAGLQYHSGALMALAAPTVNCYKRILPGSFAPVNNSWGVDNRTVAYRCKNYSEEGTYIEDRVPSGGVNPYLVMASVIMAGVDGIKRGLDLGEATRGSAYDEDNHVEGTIMLPKSLEKSLECFLNDKTLCDGFGQDFMKGFTAVKKLEISQANMAKANDRLSTWEKEFYFEYL